MKNNRVVKHSITLDDVARLAGVGKTTAGYILNGHPGKRYPEQTEMAVKVAADKLGYIPCLTARRLGSGRSKMIGFLLTGSLKDPAFSLMVEAGEASVRAHNYRFLFSTATQDRTVLEERMRQMLAEQVEGVVIGPLRYDTPVDWYHRLPVPVVLLGDPKNTGLDVLYVDYREAASINLYYLMSRGHRRIALVPHEDFILPLLLQNETHAGDNWIAPPSIISIGPEMFYSLMQKYARRWKHANPAMRPTALMCLSDQEAMLAISAFKAEEIDVPGDISVVGQGNVPDSPYYSPPLTTVDLKAGERMRRAVERLLYRLERPNAPVESFAVQPELVIRQSVSAI